MGVAGGVELMNGLITNATLVELDCRGNGFGASMLGILQTVLLRTSIRKLSCSNNANVVNADACGKMLIETIEQGRNGCLEWFNGVDIPRWGGREEDGKDGKDGNDTPTTTATTLAPTEPRIVDDVAAQLIWYLIASGKAMYQTLQLQEQLIHDIGALYLCKACDCSKSGVLSCDLRHNPIGLDLRQGVVQQGMESVALRRLAVLGSRARERLKMGKAGLHSLCGVWLGSERMHRWIGASIPH